ncbi:MAG: YCII-related domain protein [Mucilaginibacter sp.]|nr:YCII-related domain protein [Mucilaginibacter sp.]
MIPGTLVDWKEGHYNETGEVIVGYYHILAKDSDHAIVIAKGNPEFAYTPTARIEVRPIKMLEESTSYIYPKG